VPYTRGVFEQPQTMLELGHPLSRVGAEGWLGLSPTIVAFPTLS